MNYKSIVKDQQLRFRILRLLQWVPDSVMLRVQYRMKLGFWPNFKSPTRFTEKLQLYKMKYHNPVMHQCVDKYEVRKFVESKGLGNILNELYGVYDKPEEIDFDTLPDKFVMKTTTGGGGQNVIVITDKSSCNLDELRSKLTLWEGDNNLGALAGREWAYEDCKPRIIIEKYLDNNAGKLTDYKLFCFNGEPKFLYVVPDRKPGEYAYLGVYDMEFNELPVYRCDERKPHQVEPKPQNYEEMVEIARKLSADFPHVRVDLYNIDGRIYFGELTFYDGSGYFHYDPDSFDLEVGSYFDVTKLTGGGYFVRLRIDVYCLRNSNTPAAAFTGRRLAA